MCMGLDQYDGESLNYDLCGSGDGGYAVSGCLISARIPLAAIRRVMKFRENLDKKDINEVNPQSGLRKSLEYPPSKWRVLNYISGPSCF